MPVSPFPPKRPAPERIANPTGERRASSTVKVKVFSPSHARSLAFPRPPVAYTVVAAPSRVEVFAVSM